MSTYTVTFTHGRSAITQQRIEAPQPEAVVEKLQLEYPGQRIVIHETTIEL